MATGPSRCRPGGRTQYSKSSVPEQTPVTVVLKVTGWPRNCGLWTSEVMLAESHPESVNERSAKVSTRAGENPCLTHTTRL